MPSKVLKASLVAFGILSLLSLSFNAHSGLFDKIENIAESGWKKSTAPLNKIKIGKIVKPKNLTKPFKKLGKAAGSTIQLGTQLATKPQREIYNKIQKISKKTGKFGEFIFDVGTFNQRLYSELQTSAGNAIGNILRGENPLQMSAVPLAGAIRAAREKHYSNSSPLPNDVKQALSGLFSSRILHRARCVVGTVDITLPNFINRGSKFMGNDHAVVVDDVIVFSNNIPAYNNSPGWWAHEVTHVEQYARWGIEGFAYRYIKDGGSRIEAEADSKAYRATGHTTPTARSSAVLKSLQIGIITKPVTRKTHEKGVGKYVREYFILQCFFPADPAPVNYMVTNTRKIVAIFPMTGKAVQVGWATPPLAPNIAWSYTTPNFRHAVFPDGAICTVNQFGKFIKIGHVIRLN